MAISGVHHAGTIRKGGIKRALGGRHRRVPTVIAPTLGNHPGVVGKIACKLLRLTHQRSLALPHLHEHEGRATYRSMEEMQVCIVKAGANKTVTIVKHRRVCRHRSKHIFRGSRSYNAPACHGKRKLASSCSKRAICRCTYLFGTNHHICLKHVFPFSKCETREFKFACTV